MRRYKARTTVTVKGMKYYPGQVFQADIEDVRDLLISNNVTPE
jgi:hypothetical protein